MNKRNVSSAILLVSMAMALVIALGFGPRSSTAQSLRRSGRGGGYGEFESLLTKHGDKNMLLDVRVVTAKKGEILGKVVQATEAFLVLKAQNGRDLYFVTWDDVLWLTARPN